MSHRLIVASRSDIMDHVAQQYVHYFRASGSRFGCMRAIETALDVPRVKAARIRFWFGRQKGFPGVEQLADIAEHGATVHMEGGTDIGVALAYSNHSSVAIHSDTITAKIFDDVRFGRAVIFPRSEAHTIPGLRLSPLAVVVSPSKTRIIHDLTFSSSQDAHSVNADTDIKQAPPVALGHVLRDVIWRFLYLRRRFGPSARIVLSKIDVTEAFRQVSVQWVRAPVFGYGFLSRVDRDRPSAVVRLVQFAGVLLYVFGSSRTRSSPHVIRRRRGDGTGAQRDAARRGHPAEGNRPAEAVAARVPGPRRKSGG